MLDCPFSSKLSFSAEDKLPSASYQKLLQGSNPSFIAGAFVFVYRFDPNLDHALLGLIIPKKKLKQAHERNAAKRLNREYFRIHRPGLVPFELCVLLSRHAKQLRKSEWKKSLENFWSHLKRESEAYVTASSGSTSGS